MAIVVASRPTYVCLGPLVALKKIACGNKRRKNKTKQRNTVRSMARLRRTKELDAISKHRELTGSTFVEVLFQSLVSCVHVKLKSKKQEIKPQNPRTRHSDLVDISEDLDASAERELVEQTV